MKKILVWTVIVMIHLAVVTSQGWASENRSGKSGSGKVTETMNSGGYTYANVDLGNEKVWVAAPETTLSVGSVVSFSGGMPMTNFRSKTLNRTFDTVYFIPSFQTGAPQQGAIQQAAPHQASTLTASDFTQTEHTGTPTAETITIKGMKKAPGGKTIAEIYKAKPSLVGKPIIVRGEVVKYNENIMGRNWIHIQDGSGKAGSNDLTVTTKDKAAVGKTILVKGTIAIDQDFGSGYKYSIMVENAKVTVE